MTRPSPGESRRGVSERDIRIVTRLRAAWLLIGLCGLPGVGHSGVIRGTVRVPAARVAAVRVSDPAIRNSHASRSAEARGFATDAALRLANRCGALAMLSPGDMESLPRWEEVASESTSSDVRR